ncbi:MAG TPA: DUF6427 family protein [Bacteroidales bacterium]|nr:DUF6427 family protein [Bacteroidales bacterium]
MILQLFKSTGFKGLLVNLLVIILFWSVSFLQGSAGATGYNVEPMPLYGLLTSHLNSGGASVFVFFGLFLLISYLLVHFNTSLFFLQERTYMPSLIYVIFCSVFVEAHDASPAIPAAILLLLALARVMDAYRKNGTAFCFFDASLLIGTGILFYANLVWFGLILVVGVIILRGYNIKEIMLSLTGLIIPSLLLAGYLYVFDSDPGVILQRFISNISVRHAGTELPGVKLIIISVCLLLLFYALLLLLPRINNMKIKSGKLFILLIWTLLVAVAVAIYSPASVSDIVYLGGIPAGYMITNQILNSRKKILNEIILVTLLLLAFASQLSGLL